MSVVSGKFCVGVATVVAAVALGCGGERAPDAADERAATAAVPPARAVAANDVVGSWLLEDLCGRGVSAGVQSTLAFDSDGGVSGTGGCNRFSGGFELDDGRLDLGPLAATKMMCPEPVMQQEDAFLAALGAADGVELDEPYLLVHVIGEDAPLRFTRIDDEIEL